MDIATIEELKKAIEKASPYRFDISTDAFKRKTLQLVGLAKKCEIILYFSHYTNTGKLFVSVSGNDNREGLSGFSCPCDTVEEVIELLQADAPRYGWEEPVQMSLF